MKPDDKITMHSILLNPTSKYSRFLGNRKTIKDSLISKFFDLYKKYKNSFDIKFYKLDNKLYYHCKIPSEKFGDELINDTVIEISNVEDELKMLHKNDIKIYSSAPNFLFTYVYVLNKNGFLIESIKHFLSKIALTKAPNITNKYQLFGYEKSIYFSLLLIKEMKLHKHSTIKKDIKVVKNEKELLKLLNLRSSEDVLKIYNKLNKTFKKKK